MAKIHCKECKSLKEFNKIYRKYVKYFRNRYINDTYWYRCWIWVDIIGLEALNDKYLTLQANKLAALGLTNLKSIIQEIKDNYNWSFIHLRYNKVCYLRGIKISNEDYYYIYVSEDGEKYYSPCVGGFDSVIYQRKKNI